MKKQKLKVKSYKVKSGFTLVETLVAVSIFTISILALLVVLTQGISDTIYAKEKITASYLAQEGIEYMRNIRDTFVLYDAADSQTGWNAFNNKLVSASCATPFGCYFDDQNINYASQTQPMVGITLTACGTSCPTLLYDGVTGKYGYEAGTDAGFIRKIEIIQISGDETKIFSTVSWVQGSGVYSITFSENLFNWIE